MLKLLSTGGGEVGALDGVVIDKTGEGGIKFPFLAEFGRGSSCVSDTEDFERGRGLLTCRAGVGDIFNDRG